MERVIDGTWRLEDVKRLRNQIDKHHVSLGMPLIECGYERAMAKVTFLGIVVNCIILG